MLEEPHIDFATYLNQLLKERGVDVKKLADATGILAKHIESLRYGNYQDLPAAPYLRGYVLALGEALDFDGAEWWRHIIKEEHVLQSGPDDKLPRDRIARVSYARGIIWGSVIVIIVGLYVGLRFTRILGIPELIVSYPSEGLIEVETEQVILRGTLKNGSSLELNGERIEVSEEGLWERKIVLQEGLNVLELTALKVLGKEKTVIRQIMYVPNITKPVTTTSKSTSEFPSTPPQPPRP